MMQGPTKRQRQSSFFLDLPRHLSVWFFKTYCSPCEKYAVHLAHFSNVSFEQGRLLACLAARYECTNLLVRLMNQYELHEPELRNEAFKGDAVRAYMMFPNSSSPYRMNEAARCGKPKIFAHLFWLYAESCSVQDVCESGNLEVINYYVRYCPMNKLRVFGTLVETNNIETLKFFESSIDDDDRNFSMQHAVYHKSWNVLIWLNRGSEDFSKCDFLTDTWRFFRAQHVEGVKWLVERGLKPWTIYSDQCDNLTTQHNLMLLGINVQMRDD
jgi:hypothetical protein